MRVALVLAVLLVACTPTVVAPSPSPTEDPRISDLATQVQALQMQIGEERQIARSENAKLYDRAMNAECCATFQMWGTTQEVGPSQSLVGGAPDTFTVHMRLVASTPIRVRIMTVDQYASLRAGLPVQVLTFGPSTSIDEVFHDAEGCASYMYLIDAADPAVIWPDVTITRHPSPPTGACR